MWSFHTRASYRDSALHDPTLEHKIKKIKTITNHPDIVLLLNSTPGKNEKTLNKKKRIL